MQTISVRLTYSFLKKIKNSVFEIYKKKLYTLLKKLQLKKCRHVVYQNKALYKCKRMAQISASQVKWFSTCEFLKICKRTQNCAFFAFLNNHNSKTVNQKNFKLCMFYLFYKQNNPTKNYKILNRSGLKQFYFWLNTCGLTHAHSLQCISIGNILRN